MKPWSFAGTVSFSSLLEVVGSDLKSVKVVLIINKTMIVLYIDVAYAFLSHLNQDTRTPMSLSV